MESINSRPKAVSTFDVPISGFFALAMLSLHYGCSLRMARRASSFQPGGVVRRQTVGRKGVAVVQNNRYASMGLKLPHLFVTR
jgi:hypothetical protein